MNQGEMLVVFILGILVGGGGWLSYQPTYRMWVIVPILAAVLFFLMLIGLVHL